MSRSLIIFEQSTDDFGPLALTRPVYGLRAGMSTLGEKIANHPNYQGAAVHLAARPYIEPILPQIVYFRGIFERGATSGGQLPQGPALLVDGAVIATISQMPPLEGPNEVGVVKETIEENGSAVERTRLVYARVEDAGNVDLAALQASPESLGLPVKDVTGDLVVATFPWHLVIYSCDVLKAEYEQRRKTNDHTPEGVVFRGERGKSFISESADVCPGVIIDARGSSVYIGENVEVQGCVFLDAREGPIFIDDSPGKPTVIQAGSQVYGPVYIGPQNLVKQATVREGCCFGPVCRVGGEIEETVIVGYSNKQHLGYLGHAVVGEWVNWGAGTTNSDLKNDYSPVEVQITRDRRINTRENKTIGFYVGDHTKTGLGSLFNTGTVAGVMSNILMNRVTEDKYITHFAIYDNGRIIPDRSGLRTAETVMSRRGVQMTPEYKAMIEHLRNEFKQETREFWRATQKKERPA